MKPFESDYLLLQDIDKTIYDYLHTKICK